MYEIEQCYTYYPPSKQRRVFGKQIAYNEYLPMYDHIKELTKGIQHSKQGDRDKCDSFGEFVVFHAVFIVYVDYREDNDQRAKIRQICHDKIPLRFHTL